MRGDSSDKTLQAKKAYEGLLATHGTKVCAYRSKKGDIFGASLQVGSLRFCKLNHLLRDEIPAL